MDEIEAVPGQVWQGDARNPRETVVAVRKEMRQGLLEPTEVEMLAANGDRWTRLPAELPGMKLVHQPEEVDRYRVEVIYIFDGVMRVTNCWITRDMSTEEDIPRILVMPFTGSQRDAERVHIIRTVRR